MRSWKLLWSVLIADVCCSFYHILLLFIPLCFQVCALYFPAKSPLLYLMTSWFDQNISAAEITAEFVVWSVRCSQLKVTTRLWPPWGLLATSGLYILGVRQKWWWRLYSQLQESTVWFVTLMLWHCWLGCSKGCQTFKNLLQKSQVFAFGRPGVSK